MKKKVTVDFEVDFFNWQRTDTNWIEHFEDCLRHLVLSLTYFFTGTVKVGQVRMEDVKETVH